jgi:hypothetical protein
LFEFVTLQFGDAFRANNAKGGSCAAEAPTRLESVGGTILADANRAWEDRWHHAAYAGDAKKFDTY